MRAPSTQGCLQYQTWRKPGNGDSREERQEVGGRKEELKRAPRQIKRLLHKRREREGSPRKS